MKITTIFLVSVLISAGLYAQTSPVFVYGFTDASVPPQYHRSYTIRVSSTEVKFSVTNYVETFIDETYPTTQQAFNDFQKKLKACKIKIKKTKTDDGGCTGGTGDAFTLPFTGGKTLEGSSYNCGGTRYGDISGKLDAAIQIFQSMVPDFNLKLAGTRE
jgi:hypothetical protein